MVNLTCPLAAGGDPNTALLVDRAADDQFVLRFVAREDRKDDPRLRRFVETCKDPQVKAFIRRTLPGFVPAWPGA
ncbi:MetQ/NlpA family ABC transporter substrate-binding protein [Methylobacterium sp. CB376]|uniref:MetQ/NlpA family ABC transporter substrate-binding protein n=1 Tax=Methylobacterium sp. CB376 TaxID=3138063 RepID=UPI0002E467B3|nr:MULTISPECIES: MetQ/NlpA family ABC transporter substrate-binding protein [Methylobacterium]WFT78814.1 MetQ/NlpA family ABC transporter substrate-binding protein [Methylobacterium nodulans]